MLSRLRQDRHQHLNQCLIWLNVCWHENRHRVLPNRRAIECRMHHRPVSNRSRDLTVGIEIETVIVTGTETEAVMTEEIIETRAIVIFVRPENPVIAGDMIAAPILVKINEEMIGLKTSAQNVGLSALQSRLNGQKPCFDQSHVQRSPKSLASQTPCISANLGMSQSSVLVRTERSSRMSMSTRRERLR